MTITKDDYWSVIPRDGIEYPLQTLAKSIITWGGSRNGVVPMRGEDVRIPWKIGEQEEDRVPDSRTLGFEMWAIGCDDNGAVPGGDKRIQFIKNWRTLQRIFWNQGRVFTLRKRFYDETGTLRTADARARYSDGMDPEMMGRFGAKFTVDVKLADPFFYSAPVTINFNTATATSQAVTILGDYHSAKISLSGVADAVTGVTSPSLAVATSYIPRSFLISAIADPGAAIVIDFGGQLAQFGNTVVSPKVQHSGEIGWFTLPTGAQTLTVNRSDGNWSGSLVYTPAWM